MKISLTMLYIFKGFYISIYKVIKSIMQKYIGFLAARFTHLPGILNRSKSLSLVSCLGLSFKVFLFYFTPDSPLLLSDIIALVCVNGLKKKDKLIFMNITNFVGCILLQALFIFYNVRTRSPTRVYYRWVQS